MFEGKTFLDILQLGGLTMYVLLLCSLISITIFLERLFYYTFTRRIEILTDDMQLCASELLCMLEEE